LHQADSTTQSARAKIRERWITLELKLLADVGVIGLPNVGKSTFVSRVSAARPKIADYPFTTLVPHLGVVQYGEQESFVIADIPGLIEGAHEGHGMGMQFLRHVERSAALLHILDISQESTRSAWQDYTLINRELELFSPAMGKKRQVVAVGKLDLPETHLDMVRPGVLVGDCRENSEYVNFCELAIRQDRAQGQLPEFGICFSLHKVFGQGKALRSELSAQLHQDP